jgi:hypothetical protein
MYFPTICVDNFYTNPNKIREFALSQEFSATTQIPWPGKRTRSLDMLDSFIFKNFCDKLFSLTFDFKKTNNLKYSVETYFQIMEPAQYADINEGWVHLDYKTYAGVIYLTPDMGLDCGTSIYRSKNCLSGPINMNEKQDMYLNFDTSKSKFYQQKIKENNELFEETISFKNIYNRLVAYDGFQYHGVPKFLGSDQKPRLTQVFFVHEISSDYFPIPASRQVSL